MFSQKERGIKPEEVIRDCKTQQSTEGLQQVQLLSPSVLVEIVGHAVCNVKENKVGGLRIISQPAQQMFLKLLLIIQVPNDYYHHSHGTSEDNYFMLTPGSYNCRSTLSVIKL